MRSISRRTMLRGAGACLALPVLEAMAPRNARAADGGLRNFLVFFAPNGVDTARFHPPAGPFTAATLTAPMRDLAGFETGEGVWPAAASVVDEITVVRGIDHSPIARDIHVCSMALSAHTDRDDSLTPSQPTLDQVLADHITAADAPFRNLAMSATGDTALTQGYLSFRASGQVDPGFRSPTDVFETLFGDGADPEAAERRRLRRQSVLDHVRDDASRLQQRLGRNDRARLEQYLESVFELETQIQASALCSGAEMPAGGGPDMHGKTKLFADLGIMALTCGLTNVVTVQWSNSWDLGYRNYELGENIGDWSDHFISHKLGDADRATDLDGLPQAEAMRIANARVELTTRFKMRRFANVIDALRKVTTTTGTLLDETLVLYTSENADGDSHSRVNMPILLAGGRAGGFESGRVIDAAGAPTGALHGAILRKFGVEIERYGDPAAPPLADL